MYINCTVRREQNISVQNQQKHILPCMLYRYPHAYRILLNTVDNFQKYECEEYFNVMEQDVLVPLLLCLITSIWGRSMNL